MSYLFLAILLILSACSKENLLKSGDYYFKKGIYPKAIHYYERYLTKLEPDHFDERAFILISLARSYAKLGDYAKSYAHYEQAARANPMGPWAAQARYEMLSTPDYFPLKEGWVAHEGDYQTKGAYMYAQNTIEKHHDQMFLARRKIFTNKEATHLVRQVLVFYTKEPGLIWERVSNPDDPHPTLLLRFPYRKGYEWNTTRSGQKVKRTITQDSLAITTSAGAFSNCIEVAETFQELSSEAKIYDTYCPNVGRARTATGKGDLKQPVSELLEIR